MAEDIDKFRFVEQDSFPYTECRGFVRPGMAALFKNYILPSDRQCPIIKIIKKDGGQQYVNRNGNCSIYY